MKNVKVARLISGGYVIGQLKEDKLINTKEVRVVQDIQRGANGQPIMNAQNQPQMTMQIGIGPLDLLNPTSTPDIGMQHILFFIDKIPEELLSRYVQLITGIVTPKPEIKIIKR
jgi:hypothetical protein